MAGGSILDMQDLGDGRYQAIMANGSTPIFTGDAGRQAYERLRKEESAVGPNALAQAPKERKGTTVVEEPRGDWVERAPQDRPSESKPTGVVPGGYAQALQESPPAAPAATQQASPAPQPSGPTALPHSVEAIDPVTQKKIVGPGVMINGQMFVDRGPGTKGSPGGVTALGKQVLQGRADAAAAADPYEQEAAAAQEAGKDIAIQQVEKQKAYLEEQRTQAMLQAQNERDEAVAAEAHVADLQMRADKAAEDFANSRMPEDSKADKFFQGLGASLGAFGASLGKTPNFAAEFIQQLANNKMRKWEAETNIKGTKANNLLARYKESLGDMKLAKAAVKETLMRQAAIEADQMALGTKSEQIGNAWRAASAAAAAEGIKANAEKQEAFLLSFYGNKMLNKPATAGTPGGLVLATQGAYGNMQDMSVQLAKLKAEEAARGGAGGRSIPVEKITDFTAAANVVKQADKILGNPSLEGDDDWLEPKGSMTPNILKSSEQQALTQDMQNYINFRIKEMTGAGLSEQEAKRLAAAEVGNNSKNAIRRGVQNGLEAALTKARTHLSVSPPDVQQEFLRALDPRTRALIIGQAAGGAK